MDVSKFFQHDEKEHCIRFVGEKLLCYLPIQYENKGYLHVGSFIATIGVFPMVINDTIHCGLQLPGIIGIEQASLTKETKDEVEYYVAELHKGDKLIRTTDLLENDKTGYILWLLYMSNGMNLAYADYEMKASLFDDVKEFTGKDLGANHAMLEMILAHLNRDPDNLSVLWRHSGMPTNKKPKQLSFNAVGEITTSTHSRIIGSYANEGLTAALITKDTDSDPDSLENLFRT